MPTSRSRGRPKAERSDKDDAKRPSVSATSVLGGLSRGNVIIGTCASVVLFWIVGNDYFLNSRFPPQTDVKEDGSSAAEVSLLREELKAARLRAETAEEQLRHARSGAGGDIASLQREVDSLRQALRAQPGQGVAAAAPPILAAAPPPSAAGALRGAGRKTGGSACMPAMAGNEDEGYADEFRGWYDVQGCGKCNDYCRWVGDCGPGGSPAADVEHGCSWWSCRLAGGSSSKTERGHFRTWGLAKCAERGANPPSGGAGVQLQLPPVSADAVNSADQTAEQRIRRIASNDNNAVAVVVIVCKRPRYLKRAMQSILQAERDPDKFPIIISQDAFDKPMSDMVNQEFVVPGTAYHMHHTHDPKAADIAKTYGKAKSYVGYVKIAQHFGFALQKVFDDFGFKQVLFIEEDMEVAPDFFSYFGSMLPMLKADNDLYCVSAWNDNGHESMVSDSKKLFRTDFFPGLGWMIDHQMWGEVRDRWANAFWDEFMRRKDVRKGRHCIRPEISRSFTFGEEGTSGGQFFKQHLSKIKLNRDPIDWASEDLNYLSTQENFDAHLQQEIMEATDVPYSQVDSKINKVAMGGSIRILYDDKTEYKKIAKKFGLMPDEKEGIRRMAYKGVIIFMWQGRRIYLHTSSWPTDL